MNVLPIVVHLGLAVLQAAALAFGLGLLPAVWVLWRGGLGRLALVWGGVAALLLGLFFAVPLLFAALKGSLGEVKPEVLWIAYGASGLFLLLLVPEPLRQAQLRVEEHGHGGRRRKRVRRVRSGLI